MNKLLSITGLLIFQACNCFAQETYDLGEIYVNAGLQEININKTGSSVLVLQSDELNANVFDAINLLDSQSGIAMSASGGIGSQTGIRLRGLSQATSLFAWTVWIFLIQLGPKIVMTLVASCLQDLTKLKF